MWWVLILTGVAAFVVAAMFGIAHVHGDRYAMAVTFVVAITLLFAIAYTGHTLGEGTLARDSGLNRLPTNETYIVIGTVITQRGYAVILQREDNGALQAYLLDEWPGNRFRISSGDPRYQPLE